MLLSRQHTSKTDHSQKNPRKTQGVVYSTYDLYVTDRDPRSHPNLINIAWWLLFSSLNAGSKKI